MTYAKLYRLSGGALEHIQFLLGHASAQTTERYLGGRQDLHVAVNDNLGVDCDGNGGGECARIPGVLPGCRICGSRAGPITESRDSTTRVNASTKPTNRHAQQCANPEVVALVVFTSLCVRFGTRGVHYGRR